MIGLLGLSSCRVRPRAHDLTTASYRRGAIGCPHARDYVIVNVYNQCYGVACHVGGLLIVDHSAYIMTHLSKLLCITFNLS